MDLNTIKTLQEFQFYSRIKRILTKVCYGLILGGIFIYIFYGFNGKNSVKIVNDYKSNRKNFTTEKIMTNPHIKLQYDDAQIYDIQALKAIHQNQLNGEMLLFDVFADGDLGKITAGELKIDEAGDHLVFTKNPILILNQTEGK